jgi:hypothetical protein
MRIYLAAVFLIARVAAQERSVEEGSKNGDSSIYEEVCKSIPGDRTWPADEVWKKGIPGVVQSPKAVGNTTRPDWVVNAQGPADVQAAVRFAAKHNVRVSIYNSGHDFLGRYDILPSILPELILIEMMHQMDSGSMFSTSRAVRLMKSTPQQKQESLQ